MTNAIPSIEVYNFNLDPYAAGVVGALLVKKIIEIARNRFSNLSEKALASMAFVGGCCVVVGAYYAAAPVLIITSIALIALTVGSKGGPLALPSFLVDMNAEAKKKPFPKYIGTEETIAQLEGVLRRTQTTNAILVGPPGVGKTAVIETLVQKIVDNQLPAGSPFKGKKIFRLSIKDFLGGGESLFGGTHLRGQLASRVQALVRVSKSDPNAIIFIDEMHLIKARSGLNTGAEEIGELLKDCLDRNELRIIGATTDVEYDSFIASDGPLSRRLNKISMVPPDAKKCVRMIQARREHFNRHYQTQVSDEAIAAAVVFASRYRSDKALPYSAVDVLETVCSSHDQPLIFVRVGHIAAVHPKIKSLDYLNKHYPALLQD